jgi:hypothetical protein
LDLAALRLRPSIAFAPNTAIARAIALCIIGGPELDATVEAVTRSPGQLVLPSTMGVKGRGAVRTDDTEIFETIVVSQPVDVIEDQRHSSTHPDFVLTTHLAPPSLKPVLEQPRLKMSTRVG